MPIPLNRSPISDLSGSDLNYTILSALEKLFHPDATAEQRIIGLVIQVLARHIGCRPHTADPDDLLILLAVSVALERAEQPKPAPGQPADARRLPG